MIIVTMVDPLGQIVREIADPAVTQKSIALTYAFAIRQQEANFSAANRAIVDRWGARGLSRIKNLAWDYVAGRKSP